MGQRGDSLFPSGNQKPSLQTWSFLKLECKDAASEPHLTAVLLWHFFMNTGWHSTGICPSIGETHTCCMLDSPWDRAKRLLANQGSLLSQAGFHWCGFYPPLLSRCLQFSLTHLHNLKSTFLCWEAFPHPTHTLKAALALNLILTFLSETEESTSWFRGFWGQGEVEFGCQVYQSFQAVWACPQFILCAVFPCPTEHR